MASFNDFPSISCQIECEKKFVPKVGRFNAQTQKQKKGARTMSTITSEKATTGGQEPHPLIRVVDKIDHSGFHAVNDSNQWMSVYPTTGFTQVKSVLDSGANDSCTRLHVSTGEKQTFRRKQKRTNLHCSRREENCQ